MIQTSECRLENISAHLIGNKYKQEQLVLSDGPVKVTDPQLSEILEHYFLSHFTSPEYFSFKISDADGQKNPVYDLAKKIFDGAEPGFHSCSQKIAQILYDQSNHPNIKSGELYVVYIRDIILDDELTDAIGLYKSETKQAFLKTKWEGNNVVPDYDHGTNPDKLDKACLIVNTNPADGFRLCVTDKTNSGEEARFWKDRFLQVAPCADNYHFTGGFIKATKQFVFSKDFDDQFDLEKTDKIEILNSSVQYFRDNDEFNMTDYADRIFRDENMALSFQNFRKDFQEKNGLPLSDEFEISEPAVKKQSRLLKSVLKLDKNFHIYIHGDRRLIEKGYDEEKGKYFYKIYFDEER